MRLTEHERHTLTQLARDCFGSEVIVRLFGSRLDDNQRGGDIDLLIETKLHDPARIAHAHTRLLAGIYTRLGERKVDILIDYPERRHRPPIYERAYAVGMVLQ
jgi:predicted nucleotidyltransferase